MRQAGMKELSRAAINRLPRYYRCLRILINNGVLRISSDELAGLVGLSASQVRGDLAALGELGQQGYGYSVKTLYAEIASRLGAGDSFEAVIFGASPLGLALASSPLLSRRGVRPAALLYTKEVKITEGGDAQSVTYCEGVALPDGCEILPVSELNKIKSRDIAILACDDGEVPEIYRLIADHGFRGVWNLTEFELRGSASTRVINARIGDSLMMLTYGLHSGDWE